MGVQLEDILSVVFTNLDAWYNFVGTGEHNLIQGYCNNQFWVL